MSFGKHFGITVFFALIMAVLHYVNAEFIVIDSIVPGEGITIEDWIAGYEFAGIAASVLGVVTSAIWYFIGNNHTGSRTIATKYLLLFVLSLSLGFSTIFMLDASIDGAGMTKILLTITSAIVYYLSSLFASADSVRNIPPMSGFFHCLERCKL